MKNRIANLNLSAFLEYQKIKKLLLSMILVPFHVACNPAEKKGAELNGKAQNLAAGFFVISGPGESRDTVRPDADGNFTFTAKTCGAIP